MTIGSTEGSSYQFLSNYNLSASVAIKPRLEPYREGDTTELKGMKRNSSFDLSLDAALDVARGTSLLTEAATEFTGEHNGHEFYLALRQFIPGLDISVFIKGGVKCQNEKLTSFLYGVQNSEQLSNHVANDPGHVLIPYITANAICGVT